MQTTETSEAETLTVEEVAALIADAPAETPAAFVPDTEAGVDWVLARVAAARAEANLIRENGERMAREAERRAEYLEWKYGGALQTWVRAQLDGGKKRSVRLFHGVVGFRQKPAGIQVTDPAALLAWTKENLPEAVTEALDKKALAARLLDTGEAASGARLTPSEEVFYIR